MEKRFLLIPAFAVAGGVYGYFIGRKLDSKDDEVVFEVTNDSVRERVEAINAAKEAEFEEDEGIFVNFEPDIKEDADDEDMHIDSVMEFISMEEYEGIVESTQPDYDKMHLTLYSDGVLIGDDREGPLDPEDTIGLDAVELLKHNEYTNVVYVRNKDLGADYEVVLVPETFRENG